MARKTSSSSKPSRDLHPPEIKLPVRFDDRDIAAALKSLKSTPIPARLKLLPQVLEEWATIDLPEYARAGQICLPIEVRVLEASCKNIEALKRALTGSEKEIVQTHFYLAHGPILGSGALRLSHEHVDLKIADVDTHAPEILEILRDYIPRIKPKRGRPRNFASPKVISDLADIFHWLTGATPSRAVDPNQDSDCSEFYDFCAALWPAIYANADHGLHSAQKEWATYVTTIRDQGEKLSDSKRYKNLSALIANIDIRHPDWRLHEY